MIIKGNSMTEHKVGEKTIFVVEIGMRKKQYIIPIRFMVSSRSSSGTSTQSMNILLSLCALEHVQDLSEYSE